MIDKTMPITHEPEDPALRVLMAAYQAGDAEAFHSLHQSLAADLLAYLRVMSRAPDRAEDLLQETFLQIHRSRATHTPGEPVRPWVFAIAKRVFLMHRRSTGRRERHELRFLFESYTQPATLSEADRVYARRLIASILRKVPSIGRRAFVLRYQFGFTFKEVGALLGINPGAAKIRSSRAAMIMRDLVRETRDG